MHGMRSHHACCPMNQASLEGLLVDGVPVVSGCVPLHPGAPSEVRALTAAPSAPALVSASALFTGLKGPCLRTTLDMFHSSFEHSFSEQPNALEDFTHNQMSCLSCCCWEG